MSESRSMQSQISQNKSQLTSAQNAKAAAVSDLQSLDNQLSAVQSELATLNGRLAATTVKLQKSQEEYDAAVVKKNEQHDTLLKRVRIMYENGSMGYMEALFESKDFNDFFKRLEYARAIMDYDKKLLESYEAAEEIIAQNVETIKTEKANIESLQQQQLEKQTQLNTAIQNKQSIINRMDKASATYASNIANLQQQSAYVQRLISQSQAIAAAATRQTKTTAGNRKTNTSSSYRYSTSTSKSTGTKSSGTGTYINSGSSSGSSGATQSEAIDYSNTNTTTTYNNESSAGFGYDNAQAAASSDVVAAADGTVIYSGNRAGYGKCVVVDHGDGYTTVYANNNYIDVSLGQTVKRGDVIGGASSGYSSGQYNDFDAKIGGSHSNVDSYIDQ
jgi:septal ring factor EnvC (AmiA/AmiB activator)